MSEEAARQEAREEELEPDAYRKDRIAVVYGKQDYMWQVPKKVTHKYVEKAVSLQGTDSVSCMSLCV